MEFISNARPSRFAYPPTTKPPEEKSTVRGEAAVLSTTEKAKARAKEKEKEKAEAEDAEMKVDKIEVKKVDKDKDDVEMKVDETPVAPAPAPEANNHADGDVSPINVSAPGLPVISVKIDGKGKEKRPLDSRKHSEPTYEKLSNLSRVMPTQLSVISFTPDGRYQPIRPVAMHSVLGGSGKLFLPTL